MIGQMVMAQTEEEQIMVKVGVVLPLYSETLQSAAMAVEAGILAAQKASGTDQIILQFYHTSDQSSEAMQDYVDAAKNSDYVIGPMQRDEVQTLLNKEQITTPTIALAMPDVDQNGTLTKPNMVMMGVSLEDEAQQIALWMENSLVEGTVMVVTTRDTWQQRVVRAFQRQAKQNGFMVDVKTITVQQNKLNNQALTAVNQAIKKNKPAAILLALDREQASQFKKNVSAIVPTRGTSVLNPFMNDQRKYRRYPELNGIRLLDIPWQLRPESPVVNRFPSPEGYWQMRPNSDQRRLYALGIDAYQIIQALALNTAHTEIEGVTGYLTVNLGMGGVTYFQRRYDRGMYQNGVVVPYSE